MRKKLEYITFRQLIYTINIRNYFEIDKEAVYDCYTIRILDIDKGHNFWIDLGWYDFSTKQSIEETLEYFLNKDVLESYITDIVLNQKTNQIEIYICKNPTETLEEYNS